MRHAGLEQAIKAAGGVASLARALGIAQPSVSAWSRIPAERVLAVESLTRVHRFILRPDLYGSSEDLPSLKPEVEEIDQLRAAEYGLLSLLLGKAPDGNTLSRVASLQGDASDLGDVQFLRHGVSFFGGCNVTAQTAGRGESHRRRR